MTPPLTAPSNAAVITLENQFNPYLKPMAVDLTIDGKTYRLGYNQEVGPLIITPNPSGTDTLTVSLVSDPTCGVTRTDHFFDVGHVYWLTADMGGSGPSCGPRPVLTYIFRPWVDVTPYGPATPLTASG